MTIELEIYPQAQASMSHSWHTFNIVLCVMEKHEPHEVQDCPGQRLEYDHLA